MKTLKIDKRDLLNNLSKSSKSSKYRSGGYYSSVFIYDNKAIKVSYNDYGYSEYIGKYNI